MAFGHGSKAKVYVNGYDLTPYLSSFTVAASADAAEATVFGKSAKSYIAGLRDATISAEGYFDGSVDAVDQVLRAALGASSDSVWAWLPQGDGFGYSGVGASAVLTSYEVSAPVDGVVTISAEAQSNVGAEPVAVLHAWQAETGAGQGNSLDNGTATANGGAAYLMLASGSAVTVIVEHSANGTDWSTLVSFGSQTARIGLRAVFSGTVNRYVRVAWDKACTFWAGIYRA